MADSVIAVSGASGQLGGRIARRIADLGMAQRLIVRDANRAPALSDAEVAQASYENSSAMRAALTGVSTWLFVSASEAHDRVAAHHNAVEAALAADVGHIVYISFLGAAEDATFTFARHHWHTEEHLRSTGVAHTILRDSLYQDVFPYFVGADGVLRGPAGDGRVGAVARDDIADAAVAVLRTPERHAGRTYDLTGPQALTAHEIAAEMARAGRRAIRYEQETLEQAYASRAHYGAPDWEVEGWVTTYAAIATGELDVVTNHVETLAGHAPMSFAEYLATNPAAVAVLQRP